MTKRIIFLYFFTKLKKLAIYLHQGLVVQGVDKAIYRINFYSEDGSLCFDDTDVMDGDLYIVWCYSLFEQQGPGPPLPTSWREFTSDYNFFLIFFSFVTFSIHLLNWRSFIVFYVLLGFLKPEQWKGKSFFMPVQQTVARLMPLLRDFMQPTLESTVVHYGS